MNLRVPSTCCCSFVNNIAHISRIHRSYIAHIFHTSGSYLAHNSTHISTRISLISPLGVRAAADGCTSDRSSHSRGLGTPTQHHPTFLLSRLADSLAARIRVCGLCVGILCRSDTLCTTRRARGFCSRQAQTLAAPHLHLNLDLNVN